MSSRARTKALWQRIMPAICIAVERAVRARALPTPAKLCAAGKLFDAGHFSFRRAEKMTLVYDWAAIHRSNNTTRGGAAQKWKLKKRLGQVQRPCKLRAKLAVSGSPRERY